MKGMLRRLKHMYLSVFGRLSGEHKSSAEGFLFDI